VAGRPWSPRDDGAILMAMSAGASRAPRVEGEGPKRRTREGGVNGSR
jgi:hypothetical protein